MVISPTSASPFSELSASMEKANDILYSDGCNSPPIKGLAFAEAIA
jgi:hypothetical protein